MNNSPTDSFQLFSPFFKQGPSPMLSPFPHLRKISDDLSDLVSFKLEPEPLQMNIPEPEPPSVSEHNNFLNSDYSLGLAPDALNRDDHEEDLHSPVHSNRCEMPSTKFHQPKEEQQPPFLILSSEDSPSSIQGMIEFLVEHSQIKEDLLPYQSKRFSELGPGAQQAFKILAHKFRKLKKTKQELTKYCMRKAFKFVSEKGRKQTSGRGLEGSMRKYFAQEDDAQSFSVPFKKNSAEKTMNSNFLKRVFGCPRFAADYHDFLNQFQDVIKEDNQRKITYLAKLVEQVLQQNQPGKVETMRRLPWTFQILRQTKQLAANLPEQTSGRKSKRGE